MRDVQQACARLLEHPDEATGFVEGWLARISVAESPDELGHERENLLRSRAHVDLPTEASAIIYQAIDRLLPIIEQAVTSTVRQLPEEASALEKADGNDRLPEGEPCS